jgi:pyruvate formate lyase activating enzyme
VPLTTIDFPGRLAAVVFCQGCPWRCRYCQNTHLIPRSEGQIPWGAVVSLLGRRRGLLDGVVFSGGEPTLQDALPEALTAVRELGFETGLHTAGPYPARLARALPQVDWVGIDIKALPERYGSVTGASGPSGARAWESLQIVIESGVSFEVRTTVHPDLLSASDLLALGEALAAKGVTDYALQPCVTGRCLDPTLLLPGRPAPLPLEVLTQLGALFPRFSVREG